MTRSAAKRTRPKRPINGPLSDIQYECAEILAEECDEVAIAASKIKRCGMNFVRNRHEGNTRTTRDELSIECGDVLALIDEGIKHGIIDVPVMEQSRRDKPAKLWRWTDHLGAPDDEGPADVSYGTDQSQTCAIAGCHDLKKLWDEAVGVGNFIATPERLAAFVARLRAADRGGNA